MSTPTLPDDYFHTFVYVNFGWLFCGNCEAEPDLQWAWDGITVEGEPAVDQFTIRAVEHLKKSGWIIQDDGLRCPLCRPVSA
jgi:hypothetical protein